MIVSVAKPLDALAQDIAWRNALPRCQIECFHCGAPCGREADHGVGSTVNHIGITNIRENGSPHELLCFFGEGTILPTCCGRRIHNGVVDLHKYKTELRA